MKVKNVINGLMKQYDLQEVNIITPNEVIYSGTVDGWKAASVDMQILKQKIDDAEVSERMMFNNRKAFIFIPPIDVYYPTNK